MNTTTAEDVLPLCVFLKVNCLSLPRVMCRQNKKTYNRPLYSPSSSPSPLHYLTNQTTARVPCNPCVFVSVREMLREVCRSIRRRRGHLCCLNARRSVLAVFCVLADHPVVSACDVDHGCPCTSAAARDSEPTQSVSPQKASQAERRCESTTPPHAS